AFPWLGRGYTRIWLLFRLMVVCASLLGTGAYAAVTITSATGGANIPADKAANAISPAWTALGPIVIREGNKFDFSSGANLTLVFKAPAGFEFNTSGPPNITFTSGVDISSASVATSTSTTITVTLTVGGTAGIAQLTI